MCINLIEGSVKLLGQAVSFSDTKEARRQGIAVVHQERHLIPRFSVGENLFLDRLGEKSLELGGLSQTA